MIDSWTSQDQPRLPQRGAKRARISLSLLLAALLRYLREVRVGLLALYPTAEPLHEQSALVQRRNSQRQFCCREECNRTVVKYAVRRHLIPSIATLGRHVGICLPNASPKENHTNRDIA
jgi:hypothetical protein